MTEVDFIDVPIQGSRKLALLLAAAYAAAVVALAAMPLVWWLRLAGCSLLLANGVDVITRKALLRKSNSVLRLRLLRDGSCELHTRGQRTIKGQLCPGWFASPLLIVMRVACPGERLPRGIALLPDSADGDTLRQLRIFLRFAVDR